MDSKLAKLAKYKQVAGIAVAAIILTVIFVPLQSASAFTVNEPTLPNASPGAVPTSAVGSTFEVVIDVAAGELISIEEVELILDNTQSSVKQAVYDGNGQRTSGSSTLTRGHIDIILPAAPTTGYGYGFGLVADGVNFTPSYSYSLINQQYAFISGNSVGSNNPVGNSVTGFVGPGQITITGKLNTAQMSTGAHTLDVIIHTGTGVNPDTLFAPQLSFTTTGNSALSNSPAISSNNPPAFNVPGVGNVKLTFGGLGSPGNSVSIEVITSANLKAKIPNSFTVANNGPSYFTVGSNTARTAGPILVIDASALDPTGSITVTVPYYPGQIPAGFSPTIFRFNESTGLWEQASGVTIDRDAQTITGTFNGLSPVVAGFVQTGVSSGPVSTNNPSGGGGTVVDLGVSYPDSYFLNNPLKKVQLHSTNIVNINGFSVPHAKSGEQLVVTSLFKNYQQKAQTYAIIFQIIDRDGFTASIGWSRGELAQGQTAEGTLSWVATDPGEYTIRIFVWDGVSAAPTPLSEVSSSPFTVAQ